jgi:pimeloyl-ACP methyl ester carboxylesterase
VLLHATLHDRHDYDAVVEPLSVRHRTIAVDWPGHGGSDRPGPGTDITAPLLAAVFEEVMEELDLAPAAIIGNSVGGFVGAKYALDHRPVSASSRTPRASSASVATRQFCALLGASHRPASRLVPGTCS